MQEEQAPKTMPLPVKLDDHEVRLRGAELAATVKEINEVSERKKEVNKDFKETLDDLAEKRNLLAEVVRTRKEVRQVEVFEVKLLKEATAEVYRVDTNELVHSRALTELELRELRAPSLPFTMRGRMEYPTPKEDPSTVDPDIREEEEQAKAEGEEGPAGEGGDTPPEESLH